MKHELTEKEALAKFGIHNWFQLLIGQVPAFLSTISEMSPEVATKAMDVVLSVPQLATKVAEYFQETLNRSLDSNTSITLGSIDADRAIINGLLENLQKDGVSPEERKEIRNDLLEYSKRIHETNTENKSFLGHVVDVAKSHGGKIIIGVAAFLLGGFFGRKSNENQ